LDWAGRWGYAPVLMETFVDPRDYEGSCYKAANWILCAIAHKIH
jgi:hypothetical protein